MPQDTIKSEIVTPPPNEPQPDREAQLDDSLAKLFETTPSEPKADPKPEEVKKPDNNAKAPAEKQEPEQSKTSPDPVSDPKKAQGENFDTKPSKEGWKVLRESHSKAKKTIEEKDGKIAKLELALAEKGQTTSKELEDLKKEAEDLKGYRAMIDIQADPEFISKFDEPILEKQNEVRAILSALGVNDAVIDNIDYTDSKAISMAAHAIREKTQDDIAAEDFLTYAREARNLILKREKHLQEYKGKYKEVLETKKKENFTKQAENEGRMQKHLQSIAEMKLENGDPRFEFLVDKVAKDPTNSAEVAQVENQNKVHALLRDQVSTLMKAETPEERTELAVAAVYAKFADAKARAFMKKIESLQTELAKVSKVSTETPKTQRTKSAASNGDSNDLDLDSALNNFMATTR